MFYCRIMIKISVCNIIITTYEDLNREGKAYLGARKNGTGSLAKVG